MVHLGIDIGIGKNNHVASLIGEDGKGVFRAFTFSNTTEGGKALLSKLSAHGVTPEALEIGLEATGHYWLTVYSFLHDRHYKLHVINPIQRDGWRKGVEIRRRKTDVIDSMLIAELVRYGGFMEARLPNEAIVSLKHLTLPELSRGFHWGSKAQGYLRARSGFSRVPKCLLGCFRSHVKRNPSAIR